MKRVLADEIVVALAPLQARLAELAARPDTVRDVLRDGLKRVRPQAQATMAEVKAKMGLGTKVEREASHA